MQPQYQMGYDRAITVFSPDGRLYQVEYAREAVKRGTTAVGIKSTDGVVLIVDKRVSSRLLEASSIEKIYKIDEHIGVASSGLVAKRLCDHMQTYTQFGGARPYGTALLIAGVSEGEGRLFETDPSGTLLEYKATGIGIGRPAAMKLFEEEYRFETPMPESILLGLRALHDATEGKFDVNTVEIGYISIKQPTFMKMSKEEVASYVEKFEK
jgi:proteasome alpha subunit